MASSWFFILQLSYIVRFLDKYKNKKLLLVIYVENNPSTDYAQNKVEKKKNKYY